MAKAAHPQRIAYSYRRVSSAGQATVDRDGLRRQEDEFHHFVKKHGLVVADELVDAGVSSFRGKNKREGALSRFLQLARSGRVPDGAVLVVEDFDRFSREHPVDSLQALLQDVIGAGLGLGVTRWDAIVTKENFREGGFGYRLMGAAEGAHEYSAKLSGRISAHLHRGPDHGPHRHATRQDLPGPHPAPPGGRGSGAGVKG